MAPERSLHFKGIGTGFLHYIGYYLYLKEHFDLSRVTFAGCSSGAYTATVMALNLNPVDAVVLPFLSQPNQFKALAFLGKMRGMLRNCLEQLLPLDLDYTCISNLEIGVRYLDRYALVKRFESREDLIACLLSSAHIPLLVDFRPFGKFRGRYCLDAEFAGAYPIPADRLLIHWELPRKVRFTPKTEEQVGDMVAEGYRRAAEDRILRKYLQNFQVGHISQAPLSEYEFQLKTKLADNKRILG